MCGRGLRCPRVILETACGSNVAAGACVQKWLWGPGNSAYSHADCVCVYDLKSTDSKSHMTPSGQGWHAVSTNTVERGHYRRGFSIARTFTRAGQSKRWGASLGKAHKRLTDYAQGFAASRPKELRFVERHRKTGHLFLLNCGSRGVEARRTIVAGKIGCPLPR